MSKLNLKIMKKSLLIIALLTLGILSAQSKSDLKKEFKQLEKKMGEVNKKFDSKMEKMEKDMGGDRDMEDFKVDNSDFEDAESFSDEFEGLDEDSSIEESMKMFVEMYQEIKKERKSKNNDLFEYQGKKKSKKEKEEYLKVVKEYEDETAKIEDRMYEVAKKYIEKK